jgi:hypothetical protein
LAASRPICEEVPLSMGYRPRTERSGAWHRGKGPGYGQKPHAEEHTQPRVHSRVKDASCVRHPGLNLRPEALIASCDRGFATSLQRVDSGPTTRRATVHSLRSGLKIESPKTREGPRVIIFRPWLEKHGSSDAAAMVQLIKDPRNKAGSAACLSFLVKESHPFPCIL